jgi:hypothetical protein
MSTKPSEILRRGILTISQRRLSNSMLGWIRGMNGFGRACRGVPLFHAADVPNKKRSPLRAKVRGPKFI